MSYILEALRKADAQRERARVPGLQAHPLAADEPAPGRRWGVPLVLAAIVAVGAASAVVAWRLAGDDARSPDAGERQVAAAPAAAPAPVSPPAAATSPVEPAAAQAPSAGATPSAATPPVEPATAIVPPPPEPLPRPAPRAAAPAPVTVPPEPAKPAAAAPAGPTAAATPAPAPTAAVAQASAPAIANAPPPGMPAIAVSGGVYSQNAAQRMLIVNGQVFNEGSEVAAGVRLEEVRPKQAVLNFRGQRFTLPY